MSQTHSPEPWEVTEVGAGEFFIVKFEPGGDGWEHSVGEIDRKEDAERIVACVNLLAGIPTEFIQNAVCAAKRAEWGDYVICLPKEIPC